MSKRIEITIGQREPLFELVKYQRLSGSEIVFSFSGGEVQEFEKRGSDEGSILGISSEIHELWKDSNYITSSQRMLGPGTLSHSVLTFLLKQEALDYESFMRKPAIGRSIIKFGEMLIEDVPSLVWGIVGGVGSVLILNWLGL